MSPEDRKRLVAWVHWKRLEIERETSWPEEVRDSALCHVCDVETLLAENEMLLEALEFYADPFTWARVSADARAGVERFYSYGKRARATLGLHSGKRNV